MTATRDRLGGCPHCSGAGFHLEIGCGGIEVGDDWVPHDFGTSDVWGHHHADADPFADPSE